MLIDLLCHSLWTVLDMLPIRKLVYIPINVCYTPSDLRLSFTIRTNIHDPLHFVGMLEQGLKRYEGFLSSNIQSALPELVASRYPNDVPGDMSSPTL